VQCTARLPSVPNPIASGALAQGGGGNGWAGWVLIAVTGFVVPVAAVVVRLRRSRGVERRQLRWFTYVAATTIAVALAGILLGAANQGVGSAVSGDAITLGIGVA